jgi:hypothetical protein
MRARFAVTLPCVLGIVVGTGCGDNLLGGATSGSRLALHSYLYEDGTQQVDPTVFRDLARGEDCAPARWSDGARYCTPATGEVVYVDDQCLTQVASVPAGASARYTIQPFFAGTDVLISRLRQLGDPFGPAPTETWRLDHGLCVGPFPTEPATYFQVTDVAETSDAFVRVRRSEPTGGGRLQLVRETTDDGLVAPAGFYDRELRVDCEPRVRPDALTADCAPHAVVQATYFGDDACTHPVASIGAIALPDAIEATIASCPRDYALGDQVDAEPLWSLADATCFSAIGPMGPRYFAAGTPLALGAVPRAAIAQGTRRTRLVTLGDPAFQLTDHYVHDTELGVDCAPVMRDTLRCMPAAVPAGNVRAKFTDDACSIPIDIAYVPSGACDSPVSYAIGLDGTYRHLGDAYASAIYEISTGDTCAPAPVLPGTTPHTIGPPLRDSMFLGVTAVP